jgi:hypothetical protein
MLKREGLLLDSDVNGRGVMELRSIYHLWNPEWRVLRYIRVMNDSTHKSDCHWLDIIPNIKVDVDPKFAHVAMRYVDIPESVQELVFIVDVISFSLF